MSRPPPTSPDSESRLGRSLQPVCISYPPPDPCPIPCRVVPPRVGGELQMGWLLVAWSLLPHHGSRCYSPPIMPLTQRPYSSFLFLWPLFFVRSQQLLLWLSLPLVRIRHPYPFYPRPERSEDVCRSISVDINEEKKDPLFPLPAIFPLLGGRWKILGSAGNLPRPFGQCMLPHFASACRWIPLPWGEFQPRRTSIAERHPRGRRWAQKGPAESRFVQRICPRVSGRW